MKKPRKRKSAKVNRQRRFAEARGSATHVGMWIRTKKGNSAHILADPKMKQETLDALATMIDAAYKAAAAGTLKTKCG